ncbi:MULTISPECIES: hypothetical protein [Laceyella]|uniref:Uncharacterized protein n=2 Tax=Laceyella TaxID=292635 RepID=A0AA45WPB4_9BACL|nr:MULTISPECIES: hypothetical protein [Laceyella]MRG27720.1 hypothetical protein [Laceyella tengchongensis]PRZ14379.1 hypothetical protein CLV36_106141 [Laceyella sediminis]SMP20626.1 hypothetical protein SAMN06265361_103404 [Laceyella tengchongensis]
MHVVRTLALPRVGRVGGVLHSRFRTPDRWFNQDDNVHRLRLLVHFRKPHLER